MEGPKSSYDDEERRARVDIWKYFSGFIETAVVKCAIELEIPDVIKCHAGGDGIVMLPALASALGCSPSSLYRIMRFLTHHGIFKQVKTDSPDSPIAYAQTALSRLLMKNGLSPLIRFVSSPAMTVSKNELGKFLVSEDTGILSPFNAVHGTDMWEYTAANPSYKKMLMDAMECHARFIISEVVENYAAAFEGIGYLVDVGGCDGTVVHVLVEACPWIIRAVNFDLPHVVASLVDEGRVQHVGGDMFESIPKADCTMLMSVLHDWDDEKCVKILKKCKEAIPMETGKVIIVEAVVVDDEEYSINSKYREYQLALDIEMMIQTNRGKERTAKEWANVLKAAGFAKHTIKHIPSLQSIIEAYP